MSVCGLVSGCTDSFSKCNREYNQRLKDMTESTKSSEGGREGGKEGEG